MHLADAFIQSDFQYIQAIHCFISMCVPWELNPQPFALLTQCSTTEPQEPTVAQCVPQNSLCLHIYLCLLSNRMNIVSTVSSFELILW